MYHSSKGLAEDGDTVGALQGLQRVIEADEGGGEWAFKALKQVIKLRIAQNDPTDALLRDFGRFLACCGKQAVSRAAAERKTLSLLDGLATAAGAGADSARSSLLEALYTAARAHPSLQQGHDRLRFGVGTRLAELLLVRREWSQLASLTAELKSRLERASDASGGPISETERARRGPQLLEVYSIEIRAATGLGDVRTLKRLHSQGLAAARCAAAAHPRVLAVLRECGGKMHLRERRWDAAATDFFEAFRLYDGAGSQRRLDCLRYLSLATMLGQRGIDPLQEQGARAFRDDPSVRPMTLLAEAWQQGDVGAFGRVMREHPDLMADDLIAMHADELGRLLRLTRLEDLASRRARLRLGGPGGAAGVLGITSAEAEALAARLLEEGRVRGRLIRDGSDWSSLVMDVDDDGAVNALLLSQWGRELSRAGRAAFATGAASAGFAFAGGG